MGRSALHSSQCRSKAPAATLGAGRPQGHSASRPQSRARAKRPCRALLGMAFPSAVPKRRRSSPGAQCWLQLPRSLLEWLKAARARAWALQALRAYAETCGKSVLSCALGPTSRLRPLQPSRNLVLKVALHVRQVLASQSGGRVWGSRIAGLGLGDCDHQGVDLGPRLSCDPSHAMLRCRPSRSR